MPIDVATKAKSTLNVEHGNIVTGVQANGIYNSIENSIIPQQVTASGAENKYTTRFDDPTYYDA